MEEKPKGKQNKYNKYHMNFVKENYDRLYVPHGTMEIIKKHNELLDSDEPVKDFIGRAIKALIEHEDNLYGITTDTKDYAKSTYKPMYEDEIHFFTVTKNPNELESIYGSKYYATAKRMARAKGSDYLIVVYDDVSGKRKDVLEHQNDGSWKSVKEKYD